MFKRNITRTRVSSCLRSTKPRTYETKRCPFDHCQKNLKRIHNHLETVHQLSGEEHKRKLKEVVVAREDTYNMENCLVSQLRTNLTILNKKKGNFNIFLELLISKYKVIFKCSHFEM